MAAKRKDVVSRWKKPPNYVEIVEHAFESENNHVMDYSLTYSKYPEAFGNCDKKEQFRRLKAMMQKHSDSFLFTEQLDAEYNLAEDVLVDAVDKTMLAGRGHVLPTAITDKLLCIIQAILKQKNAAINLDMIKNIMVYLIYNYDQKENLYTKLPEEFGGDGKISNAFDTSFIKRFINNRLDLNSKQKTACLSTADCGFHFPIDIKSLKEERLKRLSERGTPTLVPSVVVEQLADTNLMARAEYADICVIYPPNRHNVSKVHPDEEMDLHFPTNMLNFIHYHDTLAEHFQALQAANIIRRVEIIPSHGFVNKAKAIRNEQRRIQRRKSSGKLQTKDGTPSTTQMSPKSDSMIVTPTLIDCRVINTSQSITTTSRRSNLKRTCAQFEVL